MRQDGGKRYGILPYCGEKVTASERCRRGGDEAADDYADQVKEKMVDAAETVADKADEAAKKVGDMAGKAAAKTEI